MTTICNESYNDYLVLCDDVIRVNSVFEIATQYTWVITDAFGGQFSDTVTTDSDGIMEIPVIDLPEGLLNPYGGVFCLKIQNNECRWMDLKLSRYYKEIVFEVRPGTRPKNSLGCEIDCVLTGNPAQQAVFSFTNVPTLNIVWNAGLRTAYGNSPQVQVYQEIVPGTYQLVSVQIVLNSTATILDSIDINFGGNMTGYVIVG